MDPVKTKTQRCKKKLDNRKKKQTTRPRPPRRSTNTQEQTPPLLIPSYVCFTVIMQERGQGFGLLVRSSLVWHFKGFKISFHPQPKIGIQQGCVAPYFFKIIVILVLFPIIGTMHAFFARGVFIVVTPTVRCRIVIARVIRMIAFRAVFLHFWLPRIPS